MKLKSGFTIVELIVIIAVIAVLAGIVTIVYRTSVTDSRDNARRMAVQQVEQAIANLSMQVDNIKTGGQNSNTALLPDASGLCTYNSRGWVYSTEEQYPCSMGLQLINRKLLPADFFDTLQPNEEVTASSDSERKHKAMMLYNCQKTDGSPYRLLLYYVKNPTPEEEALIEYVPDSGDFYYPCVAMFNDLVSSGKMNAAREVKF